MSRVVGGRKEGEGERRTSLSLKKTRVVMAAGWAAPARAKARTLTSMPGIPRIGSRLVREGVVGGWGNPNKGIKKAY